jgi:hypothetical protein
MPSRPRSAISSHAARIFWPLTSTSHAWSNCDRNCAVNEKLPVPAGGLPARLVFAVRDLCAGPASGLRARRHILHVKVPSAECGPDLRQALSSQFKGTFAVTTDPSATNHAKDRGLGTAPITDR